MISYAIIVMILIEAASSFALRPSLYLTSVALKHHSINTIKTPRLSMVDQPSTESKADYIGAWLPVAAVNNLDAKFPTQFEIIGDKYVVWQDPKNVDTVTRGS